MKQKHLNSAIIAVLMMTLPTFVNASNDPETPPIKLKPTGPAGPNIPHAPAQYVTNLLGISDHTLYVYPTDDAQVVTITLKDDNDAVVFSTTFMLAGNTEQVTLPASLTGTYSLLYNIGGATYIGSVDL